MAVNGDELIPTESVFFKERKKMLFNGVVTINFIFQTREICKSYQESNFYLW